MQESGLEPYMHAVTIKLHLVQLHICVDSLDASRLLGTPMLPQAHFRLQSLQPCNLDHPHCLSYTIMSRLAAQLHQLKPFSSRSSLRRILSLRACSSLTAYRSHLANQALTHDLEPFAPSSCTAPGVGCVFGQVREHPGHVCLYRQSLMDFQLPQHSPYTAM